jgi:putative protease
MIFGWFFKKKKVEELHVPRSSFRKKETVPKRSTSIKTPTKSSQRCQKPKQPKEKEANVVGKITHYFPKVKAGVIKVTQGKIAKGDMLHIKGKSSDFKQKVASLQIDGKPVEEAKKGQLVGLRVRSRVRQNDFVYLLKE